MRHLSRREIHLRTIAFIMLILSMWVSYEAYRLFNRRSALTSHPAIQAYSSHSTSFPWRSFGDRSFTRIWVLSTTTDKDAKRIQSIFPEAEIYKSPVPPEEWNDTIPLGKWDRRAGKFHQWPP